MVQADRALRNNLSLASANQLMTRSLVLVTMVAIALLDPNGVWAQLDEVYEKPPFNYSTAKPHDAVAELEEQSASAAPWTGGGKVILQRLWAGSHVDHGVVLFVALFVDAVARKALLFVEVIGPILVDRNKPVEILLEAFIPGALLLLLNDRRGCLHGDRVFQFALLRGDAKNVLKDPYSIVLMESTAKALFGNEDALNKTVRYDNKNDLKVTGILKDVPANSTLQFNFLVPFSYLESTDDFVKQARSAGFGWTNFATYVQLKPGISYTQVAPKIKDLQKTEKDNSFSMSTNIILTPIENWHLYDNFENGKPVGGFIEYVRIFSIIGILVLLIACINFINLTTARSEKRAKEVGVRKAIGSGRKELVFQFLIESVLLTFIAFIFSILFVQLALPAFSTLTGSTIKIPFTNIIFWIITLCCVLVTALAAGSRPAFYLSSFNPVKVLKSNMHIGKAATLPRKILVVLQFSCSIALIISTFIIYQQVQHAKDRPSGYDKNRLMMTDMNEDLTRNYTAISNEIKQKGIAEMITTASNNVTTGGNHRDVDEWLGKRPGESVNMGYVHVTENGDNGGNDLSSFLALARHLRVLHRGPICSETSWGVVSVGPSLYLTGSTRPLTGPSKPCKMRMGRLWRAFRGYARSS